MRYRAFGLSLLFALAALAVWITPAQAANMAPNPSFDTACTLVPCNWSPSSAGVIAWEADTPVTNPTHSGPGQMLVTTTFNGTGAVSDCISGITPGGSYDLSYWYRTNAGADLSAILGIVVFYELSDCTGATDASNGIPFSGGPVRDNEWHQSAGSLVAPANRTAAKIFLHLFCTSCATAVSAHFDDVFFGPPVTAVAFRSLSASRTGRGALVRWRTASELGTLGFNVYREVNGRRVRVNRSLIAAHRRGSYTFVDRKAPRRQALRYWIQVLDVDGSRTWHGPAKIRAT